LTIQSGDSTGSAATRAAAAIGTPVPGTWYHLAGVFDAAARTASLYVNGVLQSTLQFASPWRAGGHTAIGRARWNGASVDWWPGRIDDARLYQGALTAAEIQALPGVPASSGGGPATLAIDAGRTGVHVSPTLYGLMFEEINHS